ncbi:MAG TPA: DinB family protein [Planctomicrobium sp.]|nr:DinB family protein [Planctomicrobium sp.]
MTANDAIKLNLDSADMVCMGYLEDLSDADLLVRPCPGANHINWQLGHLIASEYEMLKAIHPDVSNALPEGLEEQYGRDKVGSDNPNDFRSKEELLNLYRAQRKISLEMLAKESSDKFDQPSGVPYAPTVGSLYSMLGSHWMMHCGQWVIVRRILGRPPLF